MKLLKCVWKEYAMSSSLEIRVTFKQTEREKALYEHAKSQIGRAHV